MSLLTNVKERPALVYVVRDGTPHMNDRKLVSSYIYYQQFMDFVKSRHDNVEERLYIFGKGMVQVNAQEIRTKILSDELCYVKRALESLYKLIVQENEYEQDIYILFLTDGLDHGDNYEDGYIELIKMISQRVALFVNGKVSDVTCDKKYYETLKKYIFQNVYIANLPYYALNNVSYFEQLQKNYNYKSPIDRIPLIDEILKCRNQGIRNIQRDGTSVSVLMSDGEIYKKSTEEGEKFDPKKLVFMCIKDYIANVLFNVEQKL